MNRKVWLCAVAGALAMSGCDDDNRPEEDSTTGLASSTTDGVQTTIPVTSVTESNTDPTTDGSSSGVGSSGTDTGTDGSSSSGDPTDASSSSTGGGGESSSSTGGEDDTTTGDPMVWDVQWCNLQFPATIAGSPATVTTAYSRVYVEGLTDLTPMNNPDDQLVVEFGYGDDESDPDAGGWTWVAGVPNGGWDGSTVGAPNNDEYQADLQFPAAGTYDYAARVSGDGGGTWVYCDLDGLVEGGYTSDQAGSATIQ
jgi:hypothetical protein